MYSHRFLLCIDCLEIESMSSCHNPYQIQICISYMHNDQYIFYYIFSVFSQIEKSLRMDKILLLWRNFCQSLRKPSCRNLRTSLHVNWLLKNAGMNLKFQIIDSKMESLGVRLTWLDCTTQIWLFDGTMLLLALHYDSLCQWYCSHCYTALPLVKPSLVYLQ